MIKIIGALIIISILHGCSSISYSQVIPLAKTAIIGVDDIELTNEFIESKQYSFAKVKVGRSAVAIMSLATIQNGLFKWLSGTGEVIYTYNGKVIKTEGLIYNTHLFSHSNFSLNKSKESLFSFDLQLDQPEAFLSQKSCVSFNPKPSNFRSLLNSFYTPKVANNSLLYFEESIKTENLRWNFTNKYWVDPSSQLVMKSVQSIHPNLPVLEIEFIYK